MLVPDGRQLLRKNFKGQMERPEVEDGPSHAHVPGHRCSRLTATTSYLVPSRAPRLTSRASAVAVADVVARARRIRDTEFIRKALLSAARVVRPECAGAARADRAHMCAGKLCARILPGATRASNRSEEVECCSNVQKLCPRDPRRGTRRGYSVRICMSRRERAPSWGGSGGILCNLD